MLLFLCGVSELLCADQFSSDEVEGVEHHYASTSSASAATALDLELALVDVKLAMHGPDTPKLFQVKLPSSP